MSRCYWCGHEARIQDLMWVSTGNGDRLAHGEDRDRCVYPLPAGYAECRDCLGAFPADELVAVDAIQPTRIDEEDGRWYTTGGGGWVTKGSPTPSRHIRVSQADFDAAGGEWLNALLPMGTLGIVTSGEYDETWYDWLICGDCAKRSGVKGSRVEARGDRLDLVPSDPDDAMALTDLMAAWKVGERKARDLAGSYVESGELAFVEVATRAGGAKAKRYYRVAE